MKKPPYTLRECRQLSLKTVEEIMDEMSISKQALYMWENGTNLIPLNQLYRLIQYYGFTMADVDFEDILLQVENKKKVN